MVANLNIWESLNLTCVCPSRGPCGTGADDDAEVVSKTKAPAAAAKPSPAATAATADRPPHDDVKVTLMPAWNDIHLADLYPATNRVELWNTLIVGRRKNYILCQMGDPHARIPDGEKLLNRRGTNVIPEELETVLSQIWEDTFAKDKLQFCMIWNGVLYFVNTWSLRNVDDAVVGAVMVMRAFDNLPRMTYRGTTGAGQDSSTDMLVAGDSGGTTGAGTSSRLASSGVLPGTQLRVVDVSGGSAAPKPSPFLAS